MLQKPLIRSKNRLAWLTPVQQSSIGRWMQCDSNERAVDMKGENNILVSVSALLQRLDAAFDKRKHHNNETAQPLICIKSTCNNYETRYIREQKDASSLFVQNRDDYLARMELYVNQRLLVAYQEPVWPHLQTPHSTNNLRLSIPEGFMDMLEATAASDTRVSGDTCKVFDENQVASNTVAA